MPAQAQAGAPGMPDMKVSVRQLFGIDTELEAPAYSKAGDHVPDVDSDYVFNKEVTLAILAGFKFNRRVMIQGYHGTGKSTHVEQVAARLNWPCIRINLDSHVSRIDLVGKDAIVLKDRALRLILQNIGRALPGEMDRATQGQPGKYTFCCAENEDASPWEPLHVERGLAADASTVTVAGALGTWSMNMTARDAEEVLAMIADTMQYPASSDYIYGGAPFIVLSPQHANLFHRAGWTQGRSEAAAVGSFEDTRGTLARAASSSAWRRARRAELGEIGPETMVPISGEAGRHHHRRRRRAGLAFGFHPGIGAHALGYARDRAVGVRRTSASFRRVKRYLLTRPRPPYMVPHPVRVSVLRVRCLWVRS